MSNTSRRRLAMAAGAILAGAAIPIAAAGTAWADEDQTVKQLESEGLSVTNAEDVYKAEHSKVPVEVSYEGILVVDANEGSTPGKEAIANSGAVGATYDVAVAIGDGSTATDTGSTDTVTFADGAGATATSANDTTVSDIANGAGASVASSGDIVAGDIATGSYASASSSDSELTYVFATGTGANASAASDLPYQESSYGYQQNVIDADGKGATAISTNDEGVTDTAKGNYTNVSTNESDLGTATAKGTGARAYLEDTIGSSATDTSKSEGDGFAAVDNAVSSSATASGTNSVAWVDSNAGDITGASAVDTNGTLSYVGASGTEVDNTVVVFPH